MMRFLSLLVGACLLAGCLPQVRFPLSGCGGALVGPAEIVSAAHCFHRQYGPYPTLLPSGEAILSVPVRWDLGRDVVHLRPISLEGQAVEVWWPVYGRYAPPAPGDRAILVGGCLARHSPVLEMAHLGAFSLEIAPAPMQNGVWPHWSVLKGDLVCPGDSGSPYWSPDKAQNVGEVVFHGLGALYMPLNIYFRGTGESLSLPLGAVSVTAEPLTEQSYGR